MNRTRRLLLTLIIPSSSTGVLPILVMTSHFFSGLAWSSALGDHDALHTFVKLKKIAQGRVFQRLQFRNQGRFAFIRAISDAFEGINQFPRKG